MCASLNQQLSAHILVGYSDKVIEFVLQNLKIFLIFLSTVYYFQTSLFFIFSIILLLIASQSDAEPFKKLFKKLFKKNKKKGKFFKGGYGYDYGYGGGGGYGGYGGGFGNGYW